MTEAEEQFNNCMIIRGLASEVSIKEILEFDLPDDFRQALLVWKLFDTAAVGQA